jgi:YD repeat-containing protein
VTSAWDEAGRLTGQHITAQARAVNSRAYAYRADGHLLAVTDQLSGTRTFDLDPVGRVTAVHAHGWTERYTYDASGNQTSASWPSRHPGHEATGPRAYNGITLTRAGGVRFEHDALGRVILRQKTRLSRKPDTWHYEWDTEDRLTAVTTPDGTRWRYRYDPLGRRITKQRLAADGDSVVEEVGFTWDGPTLCEQTSRRPDLPHTVALTWTTAPTCPWPRPSAFSRPTTARRRSTAAAIRAVSGFEVEPVAEIPASTPHAADELDEAWHHHAAQASLHGQNGEFLVLPPVAGGSAVGWVRVKDPVGKNLPSRISGVTGSPEFVAVSVDGRHLCAASVEESDCWVVVHEFQAS